MLLPMIIQLGSFLTFPAWVRQGYERTQTMSPPGPCQDFWPAGFWTLSSRSKETCLAGRPCWGCWSRISQRFLSLEGRTDRGEYCRKLGGSEGGREGDERPKPWVQGEVRLVYRGSLCSTKNTSGTLACYRISLNKSTEISS